MDEYGKASPKQHPKNPLEDMEPGRTGGRKNSKA
jgi:hypothetical protein